MIRESVTYNIIAGLFGKLEASYGSSAIIRCLWTLVNRISEIYYASLLSRVISAIASFFKRAAASSFIWAFIKKRDYLTCTWEYSMIYKLLNCTANLPIRLLGRLYRKYEDVFEDSLVFRAAAFAAERFESVLSAALFIMLLVPHNYWNNAYGVAIVFVLIFLFLIKGAIHPQYRLGIKMLDAVLVLFISCMVMAAVTSLFPRLSLDFLVFFIISLILMLLIASSFKTSESLNRLLETLLLAVALTGVIGLFQKISGVAFDPSLTDPLLNEGMEGRIPSTMGNPNNYGELLVMLMPFFGAVFLNAKTLARKLVYGLLALLPFIALLATGSRSSWGAFAIAVFVFVFFKNRKLIPVMLLLALACYPLLPVIAQPLYRRIQTIWNPADSSISYRGEIKKAIEPIFNDFWLTGVGLGTNPFIKIFGKYVPLSPYTKFFSAPPHTHNLYLQIWIEAGIGALAAFFWFIIRLFKKCAKAIFSEADPNPRHILMAGISGLLGILVIGTVEYVWFYPRLLFFFWVVIGIIFSALSISSKNVRPS